MSNWSSAPIVHAAAVSDSSGNALTAAVDTTTSDSLFVVITMNNGANIVPQDQGGPVNTWVKDAEFLNTTAGQATMIRIYHAASPVQTGAAHKIKGVGACGIDFSGWTGGPPIFDQVAGNHGLSPQQSNITPGQNGELILTGMVDISTSGTGGTVDSGFNSLSAIGGGSFGITIDAAYLVQAVAGLISPAWTHVGWQLSVAAVSYKPTPSVPNPTSCAPNSGTPAGGTPVTITGTAFTGATGATFGGTAATSFVVVNDTTITCVTPVHAPAVANVAVTGPGGTGTLVGGYTFVWPPAVISPPKGIRGYAQVVNVYAPSANMIDGVTVTTIAGGGVTVQSTKVVDGQHCILHFTIDAGAALGDRVITLTTNAEVITV